MSDTTLSPAPAEADPILDIDGAHAELLRQGLTLTRRQVQRAAVEFRGREGGLPFVKLFNGRLVIRKSVLLKAIQL